MKTLKLFNAVVSKTTNKTPFISNEGYIIESDAMWAKSFIIDFYSREKLNGNDLNKTFHKSWSTIKNSTRYELALEQIRHYISTYGSNFESEIYIPNETLELPDVKLKYVVIKAYTKSEMVEKCLDLLRSGIALTQDTITDVLSILIDELEYKFKGDEGIKNKEAKIILADLYNIFPSEPIDVLRYVVYKSTGNSLLIKNTELISQIKGGSFNPKVAFDQIGLDKMAEIFNRFKPLFLAYKQFSPKTINKIGKLSKKNHKPLVGNPLNLVTSRLLTENDKHWLDNATPFALFKAMSACNSRVKGQDTFLYRIRNGKSWAKVEDEVSTVSVDNLNILTEYLKTRFNLNGKTILTPQNVDFALPTSEKMFVGNIPTGTKFYGKKLAVGVYWKDEWGARDIDLSSIGIDGSKVGWNSDYKSQNGSLLYSGDITSAPNGAVEYLHASDGISQPYLVTANIFSGKFNAGYKVVVGEGSKISRDFMVNPNKVMMETKTNSVEKQNILGILLPEKEDKQCFTLLNFGQGSARVSGYSEVTGMATKALFQQWTNSISLNDILTLLGANIINEASDDIKVDIDLSLDILEKDTLINIFK